MSVFLRELDGVLTAMNSIYSNIENETCLYNISSDDSNYNIEIPLIGICKEDLSIEVKDSFLNVSAKTKVKSVFTKDYKKSFQLNKDADLDNISAKLENGLLTMKILKTKPAKRTVNVNVV